ncbi:MAG: LPXTG cell wall anchor domain-containing protein [Candidatus Pacearchaeota archaeon]
MKKIFFSFFFLFFTSFAYAKCDLNVSLINQDPYPAVPGEYVKILFSVSGIENNECGEISLELLKNYPLVFDPGFEAKKVLKSGTFTRDFKSNWLVPYKVRIDKDAIRGDAEIEVLYTTKGRDQLKISKKFNLTIEEIENDFDIFVRSYDYSTKRLVFEIINLGKADVYSLTFEIPQQDNIEIFGSNKNVVGDLDSKDYTSTEFQAIPQDGKIKVILSYLDKINKRRVLEKEVNFSSKYFVHTKNNKNSNFPFYVIGLILLLGIIFFSFRKRKNRHLN